MLCLSLWSEICKSTTYAKAKTRLALITEWVAHSLSPVEASAVSAWAAGTGRGVMTKRVEGGSAHRTDSVLTEGFWDFSSPGWGQEVFFPCRRTGSSVLVFSFSSSRSTRTNLYNHMAEPKGTPSPLSQYECKSAETSDEENWPLSQRSLGGHMSITAGVL